VDREEALFLDDILIENGQIAKFDRETVDHTLMGRFGNTMLINGDDKYMLSVKQGELVRLYLTNAANSRVFNFTIPNTRMKLVGSDNGKYEREEWIDSVTIGPSERQIVEIWLILTASTKSRTKLQRKHTL
jgi:FtsP/CotA-like multicopper oxidase with cupredoxin domain